MIQHWIKLQIFIKKKIPILNFQLFQREKDRIHVLKECFECFEGVDS